MNLGLFSLSINVKDINKSAQFYQDIGFEIIGGDIEQKWLILQNSGHTIGLFQGMIEKNTLTFNPGWDSKAQTVEGAPDIRQIQQDMLDKGVEVDKVLDRDGTGPASFVVVDPDGNPILLDQHI